MNSTMKLIRDAGCGFKRGEIYTVQSGVSCGKSRIGQISKELLKYDMDNISKDRYNEALKDVIKERVNILDKCLNSYLSIVQKWDMQRISLYLSSMKNVKVKGAEYLQRGNRQGSDLEYWYFKDECIMVTNKNTLEIVQIGDWFNGK